MNDGSQYKGPIKFMTNHNNEYVWVQHGYGKQVWPNGNQYQGYYVHGVREGQGRLAHSNGDVYVGMFKNDMPNENGVYT